MKHAVTDSYGRETTESHIDTRRNAVASESIYLLWDYGSDEVLAWSADRAELEAAAQRMEWDLYRRRKKANEGSQIVALSPDETTYRNYCVTEVKPYSQEMVR